MAQIFESKTYHSSLNELNSMNNLPTSFTCIHVQIIVKIVFIFYNF